MIRVPMLDKMGRPMTRTVYSYAELQKHGYDYGTTWQMEATLDREPPTGAEVTINGRVFIYRDRLLIWAA